MTKNGRSGALLQTAPGPVPKDPYGERLERAFGPIGGEPVAFGARLAPQTLKEPKPNIQCG